MAPPTPVYAAAQDLRDELDVANPPLTDAIANALIVKAQDRVDRLAGPIGVDTYTGGTGTGLKFTPGNLLGWQGAKLTRATVIIAAALYRDPNAFNLSQFDETHGPDFRVKTPKFGGMSPAGVQALILADQLLTEARLKRLIARMHTG